MMFEPDCPAEELVRQAALSPPLSRGLKQRAVDAALLARRRQSAHRAAAAVVCGIGLMFGSAYFALQNAMAELSLHAGLAPAAQTADEFQRVPPLDRRRAIEFVREPVETVAMVGVGEWDQVEAFLLLRQARSLAIRGAL